ncbi:MAG: methyltransferase domain-containing protein [Sandaracinus sp.]|nr:methyltransferase domain-containing protein [Sandaracinus sp.]
MRYQRGFYVRRQEQKEHAARLLIDHLLAHVPPVETAVDLGCGVGIWLAELRARGAQIRGYDGPWVNESQLRIPRERFERRDLALPLELPERVDLAVSLEVAEHLPASVAPTFVGNLVGLSDFVLFSAAVPGQGGTHHVNERWPSYWRSLFAVRGYVLVDLFRPTFWSEGRIPYWYRQNLFLYVRRERLEALPVLRAIAERETALDVVHPDLYAEKAWLGARRALAWLRR